MTSIMTNNDISELNTVTGILSNGLVMVTETVSGVPLEVSQALTQAREQMRELPGVIENLNAAFVSYNTVSAALTRMMELADQASGDTVSEEDQAMMNGEFVNLAKIVAADAGRQYYSGPRLNLTSQGEAQSAARILAYMKPVMANTGQELAEQRGLIYEVISETINFLGLVANCYPEAEGTSSLQTLVSEACRDSSFTLNTESSAHLH